MNPTLILSKQQDAPADTMAWYALKVRTRSEGVAAFGLRNRGYVTYSPVYQERRRFSDRYKTIDVAAFPGYIFCNFSASWKTPVLSSPAVEHIVGMAGTPVPIEDTEIDAIRRIIAAGGRDVPYIQTGQRVKLQYGPLAGLEGRFIRAGAVGRLIVSLDLLQRSIAVQVDVDQIILL